MSIDGNIIRAEDGAVLKRKNSGEIYGDEYSLGYCYYIDGVKLDEPHLDTPEDFEEVLPAEEVIKIITQQDEGILDEG